MNRNLLFIVVGLVVAAVLGGAAVTVMREPPHAAESKPEAVAKKPVRSVELQDFIVNLADLNEQHYLKTTVVLEVQEKPEIEAELKKLTPKIRDAMITTMSRNQFRSLLTPSGKTTLKGSLKKAVNNVIGDEVVQNVYFTSFAMQ